MYAVVSGVCVDVIFAFLCVQDTLNGNFQFKVFFAICSFSVSALSLNF